MRGNGYAQENIASMEMPFLLHVLKARPKITQANSVFMLNAIKNQGAVKPETSQPFSEIHLHTWF